MSRGGRRAYLAGKTTSHVPRRPATKRGVSAKHSRTVAPSSCLVESSCVRRSRDRSLSFDHGRPSLERGVRHQRKTLVVLPKLDRARTERNTLLDGAFEIIRRGVQRLKLDLGTHSLHDGVDRKETLRRVGIEIVIVEHTPAPDRLATGAHDLIGEGGITHFPGQPIKRVERSTSRDAFHGA